MSENENQVEAHVAIQMALNDVRAKGLNEAHFNALFSGQAEIGTREALLIAHIQHLEAKVMVMAEAMEEIASLPNGGIGGNQIAQAVLENIVTPRKIVQSSGGDKGDS